MKAVEHYEKGRTFQQKGQLSNAERAYKKAIKVDIGFVGAYNNLGNVLLAQERIKEATGIYRKALNLMPDHPMLLNNLGNALQLQGENEKAIKWLNQAISQESNYADAHSNLGNALRELGRVKEAVACYERAIEFNPDLADAYNNLGSVLMDLDEIYDAATKFEKAIQIDPCHSDAYIGLGNALIDQGELDKAIASYQKALEIDPRLTDAYIGIGSALIDQSEPDKATASFHKAIKIDSRNINAHVGLGLALSELGEVDKAMASFHKAIDIDSRNADAYNGLGITFQALGQWDEAIKSYQQAITLEPDCAKAYLFLALIKQYSQYDKTIEAMEQQSRDPSLSFKKQMLLNFALGKVHADLADYDKAFTYIHRGNQLGWSSLQHDVASVIDNIKLLQSAFSSDVFAQLDGVGLREATPVFILGLPRSGKTLSETMLAQHSSIYAAGERDFLEKALHKLTGVKSPKSMVEQLLGLPKIEFVQIAQKYVNQVQALARREPFIIDGMPTNFIYIGFIKLLFPNAKVIHCYRQPMDACWFIYQKYFSKKAHGYSFDLNTLGDYYQAYSDLMAHWHAVLPGFIYDLEYERLVTEPSQELSHLYSFLGLEWDHVCLDRYENNQLHKNEISCWRHYEEQLKPLLRVLN
jgi:tetratricopeptide (TPR) repeat protein